MNPLYNEEAEQALLGALMVNNGVYDRISETLQPHFFFFPLHQRIYSNIRAMIAKGQIATPVSLKFMEKDEDLQAVGGMPYLSELCASVISVVSVNDYAAIIRDLAMKRKLQELAQQAVADTETEKDAETVIDGLERSLFALRENNAASDILDAETGMREALAWIQKVQSKEITPLTTGLTALDDLIAGFYPANMYVLAARPGMGKTSLAINIAEHITKTQKALYFSMEMRRSQLSMRIGARHTGITIQRQMQGHLNEDEIDRLRNAVLNKNLLIDDRSALSMPQIAMTCRRVKRSHGLGAILIDYLGLIRGNPNALQRISEITSECKRLAGELNVPLILLCQLSRAVEGRDDKRPTLADLRDSGTIEQDADVVLFIYREEYYLAREQNAPPEQKGKRNQEVKRPTMEQVRGKAEIIVAKNRYGESGTAHVGFAGRRQLFHSLDVSKSDLLGYM